MAKRKPGITQPDLVCGIVGVLAKAGYKEAEPRIINACIDAANSILQVLERDPVLAKSGMGLVAWLASDDTGLSSVFMARVYKGLPTTIACYPFDPADFGRCSRFLEAVPEARALLPKLAKHGPVWAEYVRRWDEMEALYQEEKPSGKCPKLYEVMQSIQVEALKGA